MFELNHSPDGSNMSRFRSMSDLSRDENPAPPPQPLGACSRARDELADAVRSIQRLAASNPQHADTLPKQWMPDVRVEPFSGGKGSQSAHQFLIRMKDLRVAKDIPEMIFLNKWVPVYLTGMARAWYEHSFVGTKWRDFEVAFRHRFGVGYNEDTIRDKIFETKMGYDEDVGEFIDRVLTLNSELLDPIDDREIVRRLISNMTARLRAMLRRQDLNDVASLKHEAMRMQADMNSAIEESNVFSKLSRNENWNRQSAPLTSEKQSSKIFSKQEKVTDPKPIYCFRCNLPGHKASVCEAPKPAPKADKHGVPFNRPENS